jgi:PAS fold.
MMVQPGNRDSHEPLCHSALTRLSDAVVSVNTAFECTFLNPAAEQLFDVTVETARGRHIRTVLPTTAGAVAEKTSMMPPKPGRRRRLSGTTRHTTGGLRPAFIRMTMG